MRLLSAALARTVGPRYLRGPAAGAARGRSLARLAARTPSRRCTSLIRRGCLLSTVSALAVHDVIDSHAAHHMVEAPISGLQSGTSQQQDSGFATF